MVDPMANFSEPGFPHYFAKKDRHDLKMGCIDASRRQLHTYNLCSKLQGSKLIFDEIMAWQF
jgi:hypothetical protein